MKKITLITISILVTLIILCIVLLGLSSCGNMSIGMGNFTFNKIHIDTYDYSGCFEIEKWYDNETGVEVKIKDVGHIFVCEGDYILIEDKCPLCEKGK